ncbi:carboxypeptidase-like regulatory domain-containing protein [Pollutibacter soli]|uniref:carboxypeptidase-like regulatory domain-containing protein n=1 Tax=Pollutibacter soli TaxID=3034157 RepID=UPI0030135028
MCSRCIFCFILLIFFLDGFCQVTISGRILNDETGEPVPNVSVYINNTTIGVNSDAEGNYILKSIRPGIYEIITSHVGFDMLVHRVEVTNQHLRVSFRLVPKIKQMRNIVIMTTDLRKKWIGIFKEYFLGQSLAASKSKILNEDEILFEKGNEPKALKAFTETPLIIENRELGYRIHFDLVEFYYDEASGRTYFYGFSRYEDLEGRESAKNKWVKNRQRAYYGSTQHFYHSLLNNDLENQQYVVFLRKPPDSTPVVKTSGSNVIIIPAPKAPVAVNVSVNDILSKTDTLGGKNQLKWKGRLVVRYKLNPYGKDFLRRKGMLSGFLPKGVQSELDMIDEYVFVDSNGCLETPLSVSYSGYWAYERVADMLPIDYRP